VVKLGGFMPPFFINIRKKRGKMSRSEAFVKDYITALQVDEEKCAMDIGANHGIYTNLLADKFKHVYAFEPQEDNITILAKAVDKNEKITVDRRAIGAVDNQDVTLYISNNKGGHSISSKVGTSKRWGHGKKDNATVKSITLDTFTEDKQIGFIKCDIEGGEDIIFHHGRKLLTEQGPVILLETHETVNFEMLYNLFVSCGYKCYDIKKQEVKTMEKNSHYLLKKE
jgi:FkbM family methyltransferase